MEVLISRALINPNIGHDDFNVINNLMEEYNNMKKNQKFKDCNS